MRTHMVIVALVIGFVSPLFAAPHRVVDYDFGTLEAVWKPDGTQLAVQDPKGITIRDAKTLRLVRYFSVEVESQDGKPVLNLRAWCGDKLILKRLAGYDNTGRSTTSDALILSVQSGKHLSTWHNVTFSPDEQSLWFNHDSHFHLLNFRQQRWFSLDLPLRTNIVNDPKDTSSWPIQYALSPDGRYAADQLADGPMRLWDVSTHKITATLPAPQVYAANVLPLVWSPDGKKVASVGDDGFQIDGADPEGNIYSQSFSSPVVKIWDAHTGKPLQWFHANGALQTLEWRDNENLAVGEEGGFELHNLSTNKSVTVVARSPIALSPDKTCLLASSTLWQIGKNNEVRALKSLFSIPTVAYAVAWSRDGRFLAA